MTAITLAAKVAGMTPGAWASEAAVAVAREQIAPVPTSERDQLREVVEASAQVRRIGNNLNQVARRINMEEEAPELPTVLAMVGRALQRLDEAGARIQGGRRGR